MGVEVGNGHDGFSVLTITSRSSQEYSFVDRFR
jgi:hypothetical protein